MERLCAELEAEAEELERRARCKRDMASEARRTLEGLEAEHQMLTAVAVDRMR